MAFLLPGPESHPHPILIWGTSGHARIVAEIIRLNNQFQLTGFIDNTPSAPQSFQNLPVYSGPFSHNASSVIIAVGDSQARLHLAAQARAAGLTLATAIHPRSIVSSDATLGPGTVVAAGAIINPGCRIGENVIVNTGATVDHDCHIADGVHIGPGAHLGGWVTVGRATWLGIGATIRDRITVGAGSVIGAAGHNSAHKIIKEMF